MHTPTSTSHVTRSADRHLSAVQGLWRRGFQRDPKWVDRKQEHFRRTWILTFALLALLLLLSVVTTYA